MAKWSAPNEQEVDSLTPEQSLGAQLLLAILEALYKQGVREVSRAMLLEILGQEDEIKPGDDQEILTLTDKFLDNRDTIMATLESQLAIKH